MEAVPGLSPVGLRQDGGTLVTPCGGCSPGEDAFEKGDKFIHDRDVKWLQQADVVVAEVTQPSLGVGYELGRAVAMNKKILCLFRPSSGRVLSAMIRGAHDGHSVLVRDYKPEEMEGMLSEYFTVTFPSL
ncbi:unnamed protein product [Staurois parvus]|uniref:2'-deoxynucleoside 5'-phosphate N-hydrolase 1 n=1 Tax=Staurois parvus TaxID=386267 RepID=A0ABN9ABQ0_9NEOB|nr:unnamed protein product [Staurois parvus]